MPEISVVIPTKDRLPYLRKSVPMFLSHPEVGEVIIVVDGCRDGTLAYAEEASATDGRVRFVDNGVNRGLPYSRNRGMDLAQCEYAFTGEDDLELSPGFFATLLGHIAETGADIASGRNVFRFERETTAEALARSGKTTGPSVNRRLVTLNPQISLPADSVQALLPAPMLARTEVFRKLRWDEGLRGNAWREESDVQLQAVELGMRLVYCPHAVSFNLVIENDPGGCNTTSGVRRVRWIVRNNWRFVRRHREAVAREFGVRNLYVYIARFTAWKSWNEIILPAADRAKRGLVGGRIGS